MARVWFITGSSRGLGRALVEQVLASGDIVVATARSPSQLDDLVTKYGSEKIFATALDVTDANQANVAIKETVDKFGRIDVLVNNAGYANLASVEDTSLESFRAQVDVNFYGVVNVTKAAVPIFRQQKSGHIIQVSTIGDRVGTPGAAAYQSAKWAVAGFSTALAQEIAPFGIKVTVAEPGGIKTDWATIAIEFMEDKSHWAEGSDIARALIHLSQVEEPPLRIVLGQGALPWSQMAAKTLAESDEKWLKVSKLEL